MLRHVTSCYVIVNTKHYYQSPVSWPDGAGVDADLTDLVGLADDGGSVDAQHNQCGWKIKKNLLHKSKPKIKKI